MDQEVTKTVSPLNDEEKARLAELRDIASTPEEIAERDSLAARENIEPAADPEPGAAPAENTPNSNSGTPATTMEGGTQPLQPSVAGQNFDQQVTDQVKSIESSTPGADGELPGGVTAEADSEMVLEVTYSQEFGDYFFNDAQANVKVDGSGSGAASISLDVHENKDGRTTGKIRARIIGDQHSRVYVFRKDDASAATTTFVAKYTPHP